MDKKLYDATIEGNVQSLLKLIQQDPLVLNRVNITTNCLETPLHIAAMLGHERFAVELLRLKPELARELDSQRSSPLHLASAKGYLEIVKALLRIDPDMCFLCDRDGRNPVHVAALRGKVEVLRELLRVKPEAGRAIVARDKRTILHLCVEYGQFDALKFLVETGNFEDLVNGKDRNGNTVLHLAVADKQVVTTEYLLAVRAIEVNTPNHNGMTAMDILTQRGRDASDLELQESLELAGAISTIENNRPASINHHTLAHQAMFSHINNPVPSNKWQKNQAKKLNNQNDDWLDKKRSALMVVASLIATMAFHQLFQNLTALVITIC